MSPCEPIKGGFLCTGRRSVRRCAFCTRPHTKLCDYITTPTVFGKDAPKICDKPLCETHAVNVGQDKDFCPDHPRIPKGAAV